MISRNNCLCRRMCREFVSCIFHFRPKMRSVLGLGTSLSNSEMRVWNVGHSLRAMLKCRRVWISWYESLLKVEPSGWVRFKTPRQPSFTRLPEEAKILLECCRFIVAITVRFGLVVFTLRLWNAQSKGSAGVVARFCCLLMTLIVRLRMKGRRRRMQMLQVELYPREE